MPQAANIVVADAQATPVNHTFVPLGKDANGVFWFEDQSQASPAGFWRFSLDIKRPPTALPGQMTTGRNIRVKMALFEPILETVSNSTVSGIPPAPMVAYTHRANAEFTLPERGTLQNRKDIRKMFPLFMQSTIIGAVIENLEYVW